MDILEENSKNNIIVVGKDEVQLVENNKITEIITNTNKTKVIENQYNDTLNFSSRGIQGRRGEHGQDIISSIVDEQTEAIIDSVQVSLVDSVEWHMVVCNKVTGRKRHMVVYATHDNATDPYFVIGPVVGNSNINFTVSVDLVSGFLRLKVRNNNSNNKVYASTIRLKFDAFI